MTPRNPRSARLFAITAVLFLTTISVPAMAVNHYVRAGATGSGSDWANACGDFTGGCAVSSLVRGDTYYVAAGNYAGRTFNTPASGTTPITIKRATAADHGTSTGWSTIYASGQAVFGGLAFQSNYWIFDGVTGGGPGSWNVGFGFKVAETADSTPNIMVGGPGGIPGDYVTIRHVEFQGKGSVSASGGTYSNDAVAIYDRTGTTVSYAWMHGIGRCPIFVPSGFNLLFEYFYVQSYYGSSAVHSEVMSSGGSGGLMGDTTFRNSLVTDIESTGGLMWDNHGQTSSHLYVYGNVFYQPAGATWGVANGVIGGWTGNGGEETHNIWVYNNTFINVQQQSLSSFPNIATGGQAYNNVWVNSQAPNFSKYPSHDYNHYINSGGAQSETHGTSAASGNPFTNYTGLDFTLTATTAAGMSFAKPFNMDPTGLFRGNDGNWDRGAYEFVNGMTAQAPNPPSNLTVTVQ